MNSELGDWQNHNYGPDELDEEQFKYRQNIFNNMAYNHYNRPDSDFDKDYDPDFD